MSKLLEEVKDEACSCDAMLGWTCNFCINVLPRLREALNNE